MFVLVMDAGDAFHIFGKEIQGPNADEVLEVHPAQQGNVQVPRLNWTTLMSARMLEKFSLLVTEGVRTDKGFKDIHVQGVAKDLQAFINAPVQASQVYNHLRKWSAIWKRIVKLKELSGANWDEHLCMITLDPEHYHGHVKVNIYCYAYVLLLSKCVTAI
jgi:hypothetical protein